MLRVGGQSGTRKHALLRISCVTVHACRHTRLSQVSGPTGDCTSRGVGTSVRSVRARLGGSAAPGQTVALGGSAALPSEAVRNALNGWSATPRGVAHLVGHPSGGRPLGRRVPSAGCIAPFTASPRGQAVGGGGCRPVHLPTVAHGCHSAGVLAQATAAPSGPAVGDGGSRPAISRMSI